MSQDEYEMTQSMHFRCFLLEIAHALNDDLFVRQASCSLSPFDTPKRHTKVRTTDTSFPCRFVSSPSLHHYPSTFFLLHQSMSKGTNKTRLLVSCWVLAVALSWKGASALAPGYTNPLRRRQLQRQQHQRQQQQSLPRRNKRVASDLLVRTAADQKWQELHGNYILRPTQQQKPRALLHFLGGAFFGAAPHVSYRYLLERLANAGYLIVATPYSMSFNHLEMCQTVTERFGKVLPALKQEYGTTTTSQDEDDAFSSLPIVGVGHSCGSLLHLLMSSQATTALTTSTSAFTLPAKQANVFISFNNHPATDSIPYFDEVVAPLSQTYARYYAQNPNQLNFVRLLHEARAASDVGIVLQQMERAETRAGQDLDFIWHEMQRAATLLSPGRQTFPPPLFPDPADSIKVAKMGLSALLRPARRTLQAMTLLNQVVDAMEQVPSLLHEMSTTGRTEFHPAPGKIRDMITRSYQAPRTLIVQYTDDDIDQSEEMEQLLSQKQQEVSRRVLAGGHMAPLVAPPLHIVTRAEAQMGKTVAQERLLYKAADATVAELTAWLEEQPAAARV